VTGEERIRFANLVLAHLGDGFALARWIAGNPADAEDIVQEACLRALRGISGYAGGNPRAWFLAIVRNTSYTWLTQNRRSELVSMSEVETMENSDKSFERFLVSGAATPESALMAKADAKRLQSAITSLPPEFREALVLREVHGLEYREIATVTGTPVGTVMSRLARARRRLVAILEREAA
jgi:RNA polymerase sigma-70 factor (ECF subfamily)